RPRPQPRLPRGAGAVGSRLRAVRLPLARGERRVLERARVRALRPRGHTAARVRRELLARAAPRLPGRPPVRRPVARGAEYGRGGLRRLERRQRLGRGRAGAVARPTLVGRGDAPAARRRLARAGAVVSDANVWSGTWDPG